MLPIKIDDFANLGSFTVKSYEFPAALTPITPCCRLIAVRGRTNGGSGGRDPEYGPVQHP
jgi:hypothetical protein